MEYEAPPLPYSRKALAPIISEETMKEHYERHLKGYITKLNAISQVVQAPSETPLEWFIVKGAKASWSSRWRPRSTITSSSGIH